MTVVAGSATNPNPSCALGVNGGLVAGVLVVTAIVAEVWKKFPANFSVLLEKFKKDLMTPLHSIRSDLTNAPTNPNACVVSKLFGTVNTSCTSQILCRSSTALPASRSVTTASSGIGMVQKTNVGETPGSYE